MGWPVNNSAQRIIQRPPRPLVMASQMQGGTPLGHKPMSPSQADASMDELVGLLANGQSVGQLDPKTAEIVAKVLGKHARHK
jgi:hypothetical protein